MKQCKLIVLLYLFRLLLLLACALGMIVIQPLQGIRVSSVQSLQATIKLCQAAGVDDVGHCLHLSTVTEIAVSQTPSLVTGSAVSLVCAEAI